MNLNNNQYIIKGEILNELVEMGIPLTSDSNKFYEDIEECLENTPGLVLCKSLTSGRILINGVKSILNKNSILVLNSKIYSTTAIDRRTGKRNLIPYKHTTFKEEFRRYRGQNLDKKTLLIWRMGGIGDIMFSQPIIKYLKETYPTCKIHYATAPGNVPLFKCWDKGLIDKSINIPFLYDDLKKADYHLSFEGSIEKCKEAERIVCYDVFKKVAGLDFDINKYHVKLFPDKMQLKRFSKIVGKNTVIIQMKSTSKIRTMGSRQWAYIVKLLNEAGYDVGYLDSPNNSHICNAFNTEYGLKVKNLAMYSKTLKEAISMVSNAKGFIGIDSSFTHISPALSIPSVGIFGPFEGKNRMSYYKYADWVDPVGYSACGKYPCYIHGDRLDQCPQYKEKLPPGCITSINPEIVVEKLLNKIKEKENDND